MKKTMIATLASIACATGLAFSTQAYAGSDLDCKLDYQLKTWSLVYKQANGTGTVRCENGETLPVLITAKGFGLTAGKWKIDNGNGAFTDVHNIKDVYGRYAHASANAGVVKSAETQLLTKGTVSLALAGSGDGINIGVDVGSLHIKPVH